MAKKPRGQDEQYPQKQLSDDEIRESTMGQNTPYLERLRRDSANSYVGRDSDEDND